MSRERLHCKVLGRGEVLMKLMLAQSFELLAHMGGLLSSNFDCPPPSFSDFFCAYCN